MSEAEPSNPAVEFWDAAASIAAEDDYIVGTLRWLLKCDPPEFLAREYYESIGEHLWRQYGIPEGQWNRVFNYCESFVLTDNGPVLG